MTRDYNIKINNLNVTLNNTNPFKGLHNSTRSRAIIEKIIKTICALYEAEEVRGIKLCVVVGVGGVRQSLMAQTQPLARPAHRTTFRSVVLGMSGWWHVSEEHSAEIDTWALITNMDFSKYYFDQFLTRQLSGYK